MSWLSKMRRKQESLRFRDSAGVPAEVLSSLMKNVTAPSMKRRENRPYIMVITRMPSDGYQLVLLSLEKRQAMRIVFITAFPVPQLHLSIDVECDIQDHVDHHDGQEIAGDARLVLGHEEYCHADVDLKKVRTEM